MQNVKKNNFIRNHDYSASDSVYLCTTKRLTFKKISIIALINKICVRLKTLLNGQHLTINYTGLNTNSYIYSPCRRAN